MLHTPSLFLLFMESRSQPRRLAASAFSHATVVRSCSWLLLPALQPCRQVSEPFVRKLPRISFSCPKI